MEIKLMTTKEVAEKLHCSTHHIGNLRKHGLLKGTRFARNWLFDEEEVNRFIRVNEGKDFWNFKDMTPEAARVKYAAE